MRARIIRVPFARLGRRRRRRQRRVFGPGEDRRVAGGRRGGGWGLSNFLLFVFHVGRWPDDCERAARGGGRDKDRRDIVLAIYTSRSLALTHSKTHTLTHINIHTHAHTYGRTNIHKLAHV